MYDACSYRKGHEMATPFFNKKYNEKGIQSSLDLPGFSGGTKMARYIEGTGKSRD